MKHSLIITILFLVSSNLFAQTNFQITSYPLSNDYSIVAKDSVDKIFKEIKNSEIIDFNYTRGGCDYRAHAVYLLLKKRGIKTFKIWNFATSKIWNYSISFILPDINFNKHNLLLSVKDKLNLNTSNQSYNTCGFNISENVYWGYHVAPILLVSNKGKFDTLVIDPALFDHPIDYSSWLNTQIQPQASSYFTYLDGQYISFQTNNLNTMTGTFYDDKYSIENKWIEQSLRKGKIFVEYYKKEIEPLEKELKKYSANPADPRAIKIACELGQKKNNISDESGITKLPNEYQNLYSNYIDKASNKLFN
jgi:Glutaminase